MNKSNIDKMNNRNKMNKDKMNKMNKNLMNKMNKQCKTNRIFATGKYQDIVLMKMSDE